MCMIRIAVGGHPSLLTTLRSLWRNTWGIIASQLRNSEVISCRFLAPCCTKLLRRTCCSENCAPGGCQSNWHQNTKQSTWSQHWHFCSGTMMMAMNFWIGSLQVMNVGCTHYPRNQPAVDALARNGSKKHCQCRKWCAWCSGTDRASPRQLLDQRWDCENKMLLRNTAEIAMGHSE